ncbi:UNVERIFIED_CONTAM: hypothetical protein NCL1_32757 [Trichonephila clavipes]
MLMDDNRCTYQIIQKELNIRSIAVHKIIHEELHIKNLSESVKKPLKLLNDNGHYIISKIVTDDETNIPFFVVLIHQ